MQNQGVSSGVGQCKVIITNHDKHDAEVWAKAAVDEIIEIEEGASSEKAEEAKAFRAKLIENMTAYIKEVVDFQKKELEEGRDALNNPHYITHYALSAALNIDDIAKMYTFDDHFAKTHTFRWLIEVVGRTFASAMNVEKQYHTAK